jgi:hypothetical protein
MPRFLTASASHSRVLRDVKRMAMAWTVLVIHAVACSPLGPVVTALAGNFDSTHRLVLAGTRGELKIVLKHRTSCAPHFHRSIARALTFFAKPASATNPDHVLQFTAADYPKSPAPLMTRASHFQQHHFATHRFSLSVSVAAISLRASLLHFDGHKDLLCLLKVLLI